VAGIIGALVAVPLVACGNVAALYLVRGRYADDEAPIASDIDPRPPGTDDPPSDGPPTEDRPVTAES